MPAQRGATVTLRDAQRREAGALTELALRSKAHWGYPPSFIEACRAELSIDPARLRTADEDCFVALVDGQPVGVAALARVCGSQWELEALFVEPAFIGTGVGRTLLDEATRRARARGAKVVLIQGDPHAEGFYLRAGAERIGSRPSGSIPGRRLPLYRITLGDSGDQASAAREPRS